MKYYWHFSDVDCTLRYGDGRKIVAGETLEVKGKPELCRHGLHACKNILDACSYAPGSYIWRVELSGKVVHGVDKSVATKRKALWGYDATEVLRQFAREVALEAVEKHWDAKRFGAFPEVAMLWLRTGDKSLRRAAAVAATNAAASSAATAWAATDAAAKWAATAAAKAAAAADAATANAAANAAATAWAATAAAKAAAKAAAAAAKAAARKKYNARLTQMILAARPK